MGAGAWVDLSPSVCTPAALLLRSVCTFLAAALGPALVSMAGASFITGLHSSGVPETLAVVFCYGPSSRLLGLLCGQHVLPGS